MERETAEKQEHSLLWKIWTILAIIMLLGAVVDVNFLGLILLSGGEGGVYLESPGMIYYNILRFTVCGWAIYGLYLINKIASKIEFRIPSPTKDKLTYWSWIFLIIAIIFSPIIPLRNGSGPWLIINIVAIALLISAIFLFRLPKLERYCDHCGAILTRGYYRNYDNNYYCNPEGGEELCFWCVTEKRSDGIIEVDPKKTKAEDDGDDQCMCMWFANEGCELREFKLFESEPEVPVIKDKEPKQPNERGGGEYIVFKCESCGQKLRVPPRKERLKITCPACYNVFLFQNGKRT